MDLFDQFATNEDLEINGTWFPFGDVKFLVARADNWKFSKMINKLVDQHRPALDLDDEAAGKLSDTLMCKTIASTILLGWEGVKFKGSPMAYTPSNAEMVLAMKDFRAQVMKFARDVSAYKLKMEEDQGNV